VSLATEDASLRRSLRLVKLAWVCGAVWLYITTGAVLTRYAKLVELPPYGYGLLAALPFAGSLFQLPASLFLERYGHRKKWFIGLGIVHRALWLVIALLPWVLPAPWRWPGFLVTTAVSWIAGQMIVPAWVGWMGDLVPARIRGRYFSRRTQLGQLVGLVTTVTTGFLLDRATAAGEAALLQMLSVALAVAAGAGIADFLFFLPVRAVESRAPNAAVSAAGLLRAPLADANFRRFLGFTMTLTFGTGFLAQFFWLYAFEELKFGNATANLMLVVIPLLTVAATSPFWGRVMDRVGRKPVLLVAGLLIVPGSFWWVLMTPTTLWPWYLGVILATAVWPAIELANFNVLLNLREDESTRRQAGGYVAVGSLAVALAGALSGMFGGAVAQACRDARPQWLGIEWTYHRVLFTVSSAFRLLAVGWLIGFRDPKAVTTRAALRYMGTNVYSNLQQAFFLPVRFLSRLGAATYKVGKRRH